MNDDVIREQIGRMRKRTIVTYAIMISLMLCMVLGTIIYYEMRIRSITGAVYQEDSAASKVLVKNMFQTTIDYERVKISGEAVKSAGYTENGFDYLFYMSGQSWIIAVTVIIAIAMGAYAVYQYIRFNKRFIYPTIIQLSGENQELKNKLATSVKYVEKRNVQLQEFIENVAHQVKTPLTALGMALDMGGSREECFFHIDRIKQFIQRLMNISRMESGKVILAREDIVISRMLEEAVLAVDVDKSRIKVVCNDMDYYINGDNGWLKECFINIISNSADYIKNKEDGTILVNADCRDDKCVITIEDNGEGFTREDINSIFNRFESDKDASAFHVGIGLNLAKLIVEAHHGSIYASNAHEHQGAQFRITIPKYNLKRGKSTN